MNIGIYTIGIFYRLLKGTNFDSVNHEILSEKLHFYGVCGIPSIWPTSYLNDRQQYIMIHDHICSTNKVMWGIPQGSILGPLLFLIYMFTDLFYSSILIINLALILFADDTTFF